MTHYKQTTKSANCSQKLYNVIFPVWMLLLFPQMWYVTLPANFFIDLLVLWLAMRRYNIAPKKDLCKKCILKVWVLGFAADFVGAGFMMFWTFTPIKNGAFINGIMVNPFSRVDSFLWVLLCVVVTAALIYVLNYFYGLKKLPISVQQRRKLSLALAVFTAPYLFLLPTGLFL